MSDKLAELNLKCSKCGGIEKELYLSYQAAFDRLEIKCNRCTHTWFELPLDRRYTDPCQDANYVVKVFGGGGPAKGVQHDKT